MKHILGLLVFIFAFRAQAGFLVEPLLGYETGTQKVVSASTSTDESSKSSAPVFGARLGYRIPAGLLVALDYSMQTSTIKYNDAATKDDETTGTAMGLLVGYDRGIMRLYAGYGFSDTFTLKANAASGTGEAKFTGTNMKIGIGIIPIRHVSVALEYIMPKYTKMTPKDSPEVEVSTNYSSFDTTATRLVVSFPFDFGK